MDKKLKCTICGSLIGIFLYSITPICKDCLKRIETHPHIIGSEYSIRSIERIVIAGITSTATAVAYPVIDVYLNKL